MTGVIGTVCNRCGLARHRAAKDRFRTDATGRGGDPHSLAPDKPPSPEVADQMRDRGKQAATSAAAAAKDKKLHAFVAREVPAQLEHTGSAAFDKHLLGVQAVLRGWGLDEELASAGLLHSIYGTEGYQGHKISWSRRLEVRALAGARAERIAFAFCAADRWTVDEVVQREVTDTNKARIDKSSRTFRARVELGAFPIELNRDDWVAFITLSLADWLEQVEGAATKPNPHYGWKVGEAWSYRREAYQAMALLLAHAYDLPIAKTDADNVYNAEPPTTRNILMERTPAITPAAREARDALAAASL